VKDLRTIWREGRAATNSWLSVPSPFVAEIMAAQGYDCLTIDMQHGVIDYADALLMLQAMRASGVFPIVRVPWLEPGIVMKALDAGAMGIICPMINSAEEAARLVSFCRYPPLGQRSFGPTRVAFAQGPDYGSFANERIVVLAMIETAEAMANLAAIAATPGLDGLYIGPSDLSISLSDGALPPGPDRQEPEMIAAIHRIRDAARSAGIRACLHCGAADYAAKGVAWGFDLVTLAGDVRLLSGAASASVERLRELLGKPAPA
jgi:4-hydroxy-2-oxoheptanedioate aldolase